MIGHTLKRQRAGAVDDPRIIGQKGRPQGFGPGCNNGMLKGQTVRPPGPGDHDVAVRGETRIAL